MRGKAGAVAGLVALLMSAASAHAADIEPEAASYDWSGGYFGIHAGYLWGKVDYTEPEFSSDYDVNEKDGSFIGGIYLGYNQELDALVLGAEADFGLGGINIDNDENAEFNSYSAFDSDWNAHIRLRAGFAADRVLFYVAGGLAIADLTIDDVDQGYGEDGKSHLGWTIGGGVEFAMTDCLLLRAEYLYDDYGSKGHEIDGPDPDDDYEARTDLTGSIFRAGIAYRF